VIQVVAAALCAGQLAEGRALQAELVTAASVPAIALVFAGASKLRSPMRASVAVVRFGLVRHVRATTGIVVGLVEMGGGLSLIAFPGSAWACVVPTILLGLFSFLTGRALIRRQHFDCACFGTRVAPIGRWTFLRAFALFVLSAGALISAATTHPALPPARSWVLAVALSVLIAAASSLVVAVLSTRPFAD